MSHDPRPHISVGKICKFQWMFFFFYASTTASLFNIATLIWGRGKGKYKTLNQIFDKRVRKCYRCHNFWTWLSEFRFCIATFTRWERGYHLTFLAETCTNSVSYTVLLIELTQFTQILDLYALRNALQGSYRITAY